MHQLNTSEPLSMLQPLSKVISPSELHMMPWYLDSKKIHDKQNALILSQFLQYTRTSFESNVALPCRQHARGILLNIRSKRAAGTTLSHIELVTRI